MTDDMFSGPGSISAVDWKALFGRLLAIFPYGAENVNTRFGEGRAVRADVYDLDAGELVSLDALIFPRALVLQLSSIAVGKCVIGKLGQGEARGAQSPPWKLADPTPADMERAKMFFAQHPPVRTSPGSVPPSAPQRQPAPHQPTLQQPRTSSAYQPTAPSTDPWAAQRQGNPAEPPF